MSFSDSDRVMGEHFVSIILSEAKDIHGPNRAFAKGLADQVLAGNIVDFHLANRVLTAMKGGLVKGKSFDFQEQPNIGEFLTSDLFGEMPTNQQELIVDCLFNGVSYHTLGEMGLLTSLPENQINMIHPRDVQMLAGAVDSGIIPVEDAKGIIDSTPHISAETAEKMWEERPDEIHNALNYVHNQAMQKCSEALGVDFAGKEPENPSYDSPDVASRLLINVGRGNFIPENIDQIKHILETPGVYETEIQPAIDKHVFESYQKTTDFKQNLKDLKDIAKGQSKEEKALSKQVYQAYKNGTIKSRQVAKELISAIGHDNHKLFPPSQEDITKLTSENFGKLPVEQQRTVIALMKDEISLDTIEKLGLLEPGKDKEQFINFDDHTNQVVYRGEYHYDFSETDIIAGAIKGGIPLDDIKEVLDSLPYLSYDERNNLEDTNPEKLDELENYVGSKMVDKMIDYLGYDSIEDSPFESVKEAEQLLEGVGNEEVTLYESKDGLYKEFSKETSMEDKFQRNKEKSNDIADKSPKKETVKTTEQTIGA